MPKSHITVIVKLYSGLDKILGLSEYQPSKGMEVSLGRGARLRHLVKALGITGKKNLVCFRKGKRVRMSDHLHEGDEIAILLPLFGG